LREAVTWQNVNVLSAFDHLAGAPAGEKRNQPRLKYETALLRYWQRYCGKNDTIGFFGPACWLTVDPESPIRISAKPGPGLTRDRRVWIEAWAYAALADRLAENLDVRRWLPVFRAPQMWLEDRRLLRPALPTKELTAAEVVALRSADGRRGIDVVAELQSSGVVRREEDAYLLLSGLADQGFVVWGADLPESFTAEAVLRERLDRIDDEAVRGRCFAALDRLTEAREAVSAAAGDPTALRAALATLDTVFTELTDRPPRRKPGEMYAGRTVCFEDTLRDLDMAVGRPLLDELAPALGILLQASRWLAAAIGGAYAAQIRELYDELAPDGPVRLGDLLFLAQGSLWGKGERPVDTVTAEFAARWAELFGLGSHAGGAIRLSSGDLRDRVAVAFPAERPGWSAGMVHSPDIQICAPDLEAINRGDYFAVLGEMHTAWPTLDCALFTQWHSDVQRLIDGLESDRGPKRLRLLYPPDWARTTSRVTHGLDVRSDYLLAYSPTDGPEHDRLLPAMAARVVDEDGELVTVSPDGSRWPILEAFGSMLSVHAADGFKLVAASEHLPRITVDNLVVNRETWRTTVGAIGLTGLKGERARYLAVRRWRRALGLPERVYLKIGSEVKPFYVDLTSPAYAVSLTNAVNAAFLRNGPDVDVTVTEMLPTTDHAWVPDGAGTRYMSELRFHITDAEAIDG
jgi:lantibiotic biosynthesis dehydratase-like protein